MQPVEGEEEGVSVGRLMDEPFADSGPLLASVGVCQVQVLLYVLGRPRPDQFADIYGKDKSLGL